MWGGEGGAAARRTYYKQAMAPTNGQNAANAFDRGRRRRRPRPRRRRRRRPRPFLTQPDRLV